MAINMIDLYFSPTPNGYKALICLEELAVPYTLHVIDIAAGDQHNPQYRAISPFGLIPAIVQQKNANHKELPVFESGSLLMYLAETYGSFIPDNKWDALPWLFWQIGGLGPMAGQSHHFHIYSEVDVPSAKKRYRDETLRLYDVLDTHLGQQASGYIASSYSIADIACYPWIVRYPRQGLDTLADYPHLESWFNQISQRPAVKTAYQKGKPWEKPLVLNSETRSNLFVTDQE